MTITFNAVTELEIICRLVLPIVSIFETFYTNNEITLITYNKNLLNKNMKKQRENFSYLILNKKGLRLRSHEDILLLFENGKLTFNSKSLLGKEVTFNNFNIKLLTFKSITIKSAYHMCAYKVTLILNTSR